MWYRFAVDTINDEIVWPEQTPLKPNHVRGFHSVVRPAEDGTTEDILNSIRQKGISMDNARGHTYAEPNMIWGITTWDGRYNQNAPNVEFQVPHESIRESVNPHGWNWS